MYKRSINKGENMNIKSKTLTVSVKTGEVISETNHRVKRGLVEERLLRIMSEAELKELKEKGFVWTELKLPFLHTLTRYELVEAK